MYENYLFWGRPETGYPDWHSPCLPQSLQVNAGVELQIRPQTLHSISPSINYPLAFLLLEALRSKLLSLSKPYMTPRPIPAPEICTLQNVRQLPSSAAWGFFTPCWQHILRCLHSQLLTMTEQINIEVRRWTCTGEVLGSISAVYRLSWLKGLVIFLSSSTQIPG